MKFQSTSGGVVAAFNRESDMWARISRRIAPGNHSSRTVSLVLVLPVTQTLRQLESPAAYHHRRRTPPPPLAFEFVARGCDESSGTCPNEAEAASGKPGSIFSWPQPKYLPKGVCPSIAVKPRINDQACFILASGPAILNSPMETLKLTRGSRWANVDSKVCTGSKPPQNAPDTECPSRGDHSLATSVCVVLRAITFRPLISRKEDTCLNALELALGVCLLCGRLHLARALGHPKRSAMFDANMSDADDASSSKTATFEP